MNTSINPVSPVNTATTDLIRGWRMRSLWLTLAWDDLRLRYRRSVLGPAWITLGTGFFIAVVSYLWSDIMDRQGNVLVPWLTTGLTLWQFVSSTITEGTGTFIRGAGIIQNMSMPLSVHVYRIVMRHIFNYMHNFLIVIVVLVVFPSPLSTAQLLLIPGLLIVVMTAVSTSLFLGIIGVRFHDFSHTISMLMAPVFFLTPIMWIPDMLSGVRKHIVNINPFTHFLAVVREPLLGRVPSTLNYIVAVSMMILLTGFALVLLKRYRNKIPYWV